jgi:hypothetical protein
MVTSRNEQGDASIEGPPAVAAKTRGEDLRTAAVAFPDVWSGPGSNEADDGVRAQGRGATCLLLQGGLGLFIEDDDGAVIVGLVEQFGRGQCALAGAAAPVAVHLDSHGVIPLPGDGEAVDAVDEHVVAHGYLIGSHGQAEPGEASEKSAVGDLHLHPCELLAQALMDPVPEGDVL